MDESLIVPISLEALCVERRPPGADPVDAVGASADFSQLPTQRDGVWSEKPYSGETVGSFARTSLAAGVHLHWALPDALTRGRPGADGVQVFPPVPNRWLVVRLAGPQTRAWVIESDYLDVTNEEATVSTPFRPPGPVTQHHRYLGRAVPLETWTEGQHPERSFSTQTGQPLSAIGYGEATFAAFYPNCRNVFGFHDPLTEVIDAAKLSYLAIGWFSQGGWDPLRGKTLEDLQRDLHWAVPPQGPPLIRTICSGAMLDIAWTPDGHYFEAADHPLEVAIGDTALECVSALLANRPELKDDAQAEFLLNAVQMGLLSTDPRPGHLARLEEALHSGAFASHSGGSAWEITPKSTKPSGGASSLHEGVEQDGPGETAELSDALATELSDLNGLQQAYDRAQAELATRRQGLFLDWCRFMQVAHPGEGENADENDRALISVFPDLADPDAHNDFFDALSDHLQDQAQQIAALADACGDLATAGGDPSATGSLAAQLCTARETLQGRVEADGRFTLRASLTGRFWSPNEPVLLLAGEDLRPPLRFGGDGAHGEAGDLACRRGGQIVRGLISPSGVVDAIAPNLAFDRLSIGDVARSLTAEALLIDPGQADVIATALTGVSGPATDALAARIAALPDATTGGDLVLEGQPPVKLGRAVWQGTPWLPLFLAWSVEHQAVTTPALEDAPYLADAVSRRYRFDEDSIDLVYTADREIRDQVLQGVSLLTQNAFVRLGAVLGDLGNGVSDPALAATAAALSATPMLSQVLSGFNQALLTRRFGPQLEVFDPTSRSALQTAQKMAAAIGTHNEASHLGLEPFHPIRAGFLRLQSLAIYDVFGRVKPLDLKTATLARARALLPTDSAIAAQGFAHLPPRIVQPARLNFRFLAAGDDSTETGAHRDTSPICGWVLVNNLDPGLAIYDAEGAALGVLGLIDQGRGVAWRPVARTGEARPSAEAPPASVAQVRAQIGESHLADFIAAILEHPEQGRFLERLLHVIDQSLETIVPDRANPDQDLAILIGRPLALTRAALSLELQGTPAFSANWSALRRDLETGARDTRDFTKVAFDVQLGALNQIDDGLIGYFKDRDYATFYAPVATEAAHGVVPPHQSPVQVNAEGAPQGVTLLIDPHAAIHATSGILPVKAIEIPPDHFVRALSKLEVSFLCSPVLSADGDPKLTLPAVPGFGWAWTSPGADGTWAEAPEPGGGGERVQGLEGTPQILEGWLRLSRLQKSTSS